MPRVNVRMTNGDDFEVREMPTEDALALVYDFQHSEDPILTILYGELGENDVLHLSRTAVSSILVEGGPDATS
jgi:hypothetical protein